MDYDGDGDLDILSGSYTGEIYLFVRAADGSFEQGIYLRNSDGHPLQTGISVTPEAHDLDGDGDLDLLIGTRMSGVFVFDNVGTRTAPSYRPEGRRLETARGRKIEGSNAHFADWDGDGTRDLVLGSEWGDVVWHQNLGTDTAPQWAEAQKLVDVRSHGFQKLGRDDTPVRPSSRTKVHVTDWNGDGRVDLLVGDMTTRYFTTTPLTEVEQREKDALEPSYREAFDARAAVMGEVSALRRAGKPIPADVQRRYDDADTRYGELRTKWRSYDREEVEAHGYVWLFLRGGVTASRAEPIRSEAAKEGAVALRADAQALPGGEFEVTLRLSIDPGWHAYAAVPPESGNEVVVPSLALPTGFEQVGGFVATGKRLPAADGSDATWFVGDVLFRTKVRRAPGTSGSVTAKVAVQVCDDQICLPPTRLAVTLGF